MRLDHLLSKEQLGTAFGPVRSYLVVMLATRLGRCAHVRDSRRGCIAMDLTSVRTGARSHISSHVGTPDEPDTLFSREGVRSGRRQEVVDRFDCLRHFENCIASTRSQSIQYDPSYKGSMVDALALGADEGRSRLR